MPIRTCVGCRRRDEPTNMVRVVADEAGRIRVDAKRKNLGRGAYVHDRAECVAQAVQRQALGRALRRNVVVPDEGMFRQRMLEAKGQHEGRRG